MCSAQSTCRPQSAWLLRLGALAGVVLVGLLSLATVSPEIHAVLHDRLQQSCEHAEQPVDQTGPGHFCAVTLFSHGFESGDTPVLGPGAPLALITSVIELSDQVARTARAVQLPPACGPPVS